MAGDVKDLARPGRPKAASPDGGHRCAAGSIITVVWDGFEPRHQSGQPFLGAAFDEFAVGAPVGFRICAAPCWIAGRSISTPTNVFDEIKPVSMPKKPTPQ
jgi:hypothetical protein